MQKQNGNFLLQALLALTLVFSFMPFFANKLSSRDTEARLYSVSSQIESVHNVARIFLRDEFRNNYPSGTITFSKNPSNCPSGYNCNFSVLESFGLPMGFNPQTIFNQDISLVATREVRDGGEIVVNGYINLTRGDLTGKNLEWAQLLRMLGMYASGDGVDINNSTSIHIVVPVEEPYSDVVLKHETDENIGFLTELKMGDDENLDDRHDIDGINVLYANKGIADAAIVYNDLSLGGTQSINTPKLECKTSTFFTPNGGWFASERDDASLTLSGVNVYAHETVFDSVTENGTITAENIYADTLALSTGGKWTVVPDSIGNINGSIFLPTGVVNIYNNDLNVKNLFGTYYESGNPTLAEKSYGTVANNILRIDRLVATEAYNMGDTISVLSQNKMPAPSISISFVGGVSLLPDILVVGTHAFDNTQIPFVKNFLDNDASSVTCETPFLEKARPWMQGGLLIKNSIAYNILCQYLYYHSLERRINHKLRVKCGNAHCNLQ